MKRFHVHVAVNSLEEGIAFYSKVFGTEPTVQKPDYAKWMVEDPRLNFAISSRGQGDKGLQAACGMAVNAAQACRGRARRTR